MESDHTEKALFVPRDIFLKEGLIRFTEAVMAAASVRQFLGRDDLYTWDDIRLNDRGRAALAELID